MSRALQGCWGWLCYGCVVAFWVLCPLIQKQLADNLLAQFGKFREQVVLLAVNAPCW